MSRLLLPALGGAAAAAALALDHHSLSAHMVQHLLLMLAAAPLLAAARLPTMAGWFAAPLRWGARLGAIGAALLQSAVMWAWHLPPLFAAAEESHLLHALEHATLLLSAMLLWWHVWRSRQGAMQAAAAVTVALIACGMLGGLMAMAPRPLYPGHPDLADQQLAGLLMWIPAGLIYLLAGLAALARSLRLFGAGAAGCLALALLGAEPARAVELRLGILAHDVDLWAQDRREGGVDFNAETIFEPAFTPFGLALRPSIGLSINSDGDTSKVYAGLLYRYELGRWFAEIGLGGAVHDGERDTSDPDKKALGSSLLFRVPVEIGYRFASNQTLSLMFDHVSNAYLVEPNEGLDTLGLRYGVRF